MINPENSVEMDQSEERAAQNNEQRPVPIRETNSKNANAQEEKPKAHGQKVFRSINFEKKDFLILQIQLLSQPETREMSPKEMRDHLRNELKKKRLERGDQKRA